MSMMCLHSLSCCLVVLTKDRESSRLGLLSRHCIKLSLKTKELERVCEVTS
jgi:hypothetical protein